jgi:hypothetical protein
MKTFLISILLFAITSGSIAQQFDPIINDLILETNLDSLVKYTRELTGEDSVMVNDSLVLIQNRVYDQNDMAAEYIQQKLSEFGLATLEQQYGSDGRNVLGVLEGTVYPDELYIICAHYDAVADYCADDNASGCAAVLESARLMSQMEFEYTIIFAFWDEEEIGLLGSTYYAQQAAFNNEIINGVINLEMFGWDSDDDMLFDIHTQNYANSNQLADLLVSLDETYDLLLQPQIHNPGTTASDHSSFWNAGYSAIVYSEAFFSGDGNPYYHTSQDRIEHFNLPYFHELSKLAVASIATLAEPVSVEVPESEWENKPGFICNFPNPFRSETTIFVLLPNSGNARVSIYDITGREIEVLTNGFLTAGQYKFTFSSKSIPRGYYVLKLKTDTAISSFSMVVQ